MPALAPPRNIVLPDLEHRQVDGTAVLAGRLPTVPLVQVRARLATRAGATSALLAGCLLDGRLDGRPLREQLKELAANADVRADPDGIVVTVAAQAERALEVVRLVTALPAAQLADADFVAAERIRLAAVTQSLMSDAAEAARRIALAMAYGAEHPYAETLPTAGLLADVEADDLGQALRSAALTSLVVVGDIDPTLVAAAAEAVPGTPVAAAVAMPTTSGGSRLVERPGSVQSALRSVAAAPRLTDQDRAAAGVLDRVVGNGPCSILSRVLREKHGYGYHPASELVTRKAASQLELHVDVAIEVTGAALSVLEAELAALIDAPVDPEWLEIGRRGALAGLARRLDSQSSLAELLQELAEAGLSPSYLTEHVSALHAVTAADLQTVAARLLDVDRMASVLVTDRSALRGQPPTRLLDSVL